LCIFLSYFLGAGIHVVATFSGSFLERDLMLSISDYYVNMGIKENDIFKLVNYKKKLFVMIIVWSVKTRISGIKKRIIGN